MDTPIRLLMVEDSAADAELVRRLLQRAGMALDTTVVDDEPKLRAALAAGTPDIIFSDFSLPRFDGLSAFEIALEECPDVPFIFHSGTLDPGAARQALARGAVEYVPKGDHQRLALAVERTLHRTQMRRARRSAEQTLRAKEQRLRDIVETAQDWIWELDGQGRYVFSNNAVKDLLGFRPSELHGRHYLDFVHPDDRMTLESACERMQCEAYGITGIVVRWRAKSGEYRWLEKNALPLFDARGELCGFRGTDRDVTRRMVHELTGLPNRTLFCERITAMLPVLREQQLPLVVFVFDLERLTTINDSYGWAVGDALLRQVAERMRSLLGSTHSMAHLGGGAFAVVYTDLVDAQDAAYILRTEMSRLFVEHFEAQGHSIRLTARSGLACYPVDGEEAEMLLQRAEAALRKAKDAGEKYLHYRLEMDEQMLERMRMEARLERALAEHQFVLHYQPTVSLRTGRIEGAEALIRWNDPDTGLMAPGKFIPVLESTEMILDVGRWALKEAAAQALKWRELHASLRIAVNVAPLQLRSADFVSDVMGVLAYGTENPVNLDLEITESMLAGNLDAIVGKLRRLRLANVRIALDDFGTGHSSLSRLAQLPIDTLKIDRSFISEITRSPRARALATAIITLARACGMKSLAEGVETREQFELLRELGCNSAQGYFIGAPAPAEAVEALLREDDFQPGSAAHEPQVRRGSTDSPAGAAQERPQPQQQAILQNALERQLMLVAQTTGVGLWSWDLDTDISHWDGQAAAIHGFEPEANTKPYDALLACAHPDDLPHLMRARLDAIEMTDRFDLEYRILRADGAVRQMRSVAVVLRDETGRAVRMVGIVLDSRLDDRPDNQEGQQLEAPG